MSTKERIQIVREAIEAKKSEANRAMREGRLIDFSEHTLDLGALERCLEIETDMALKLLDKAS
jgi:hypothetical protein